MTTTTTPPAQPTVGEIEAYAAALRRSVVHALSRRDHAAGFGVDDVAQEVVLRFLEDPCRVMATYHEPWIYARASTSSRAVDLGRRDRAQRGEGSRLVATDDGMRPARVAVCLDSVAEGVDHRVDFIGSAPAPSVEDTIVERLALDDFLAVLNDEERWLLDCVGVREYTVTEVAELLGLTRETVSRRLSSVRRVLLEQVSP